MKMWQFVLRAKRIILGHLAQWLKFVPLLVEKVIIAAPQRHQTLQDAHRYA